MDYTISGEAANLLADINVKFSKNQKSPVILWQIRESNSIVIIRNEAVEYKDVRNNIVK